MKQGDPTPSHRHRRAALDWTSPEQSLRMAAFDLPKASDNWRDDVSSLRSPAALAGIDSETASRTGALIEGQDPPWGPATLFGADVLADRMTNAFDSPSHANLLFDGPLNPRGDLQWDATERSRPNLSALDAPTADLPTVDRRRKLPFDFGDGAQSLDLDVPTAAPWDNAGPVQTGNFLLRSTASGTIGLQLDKAGDAAATTSAQGFDSLVLNVDEPTNDRPSWTAAEPASQGRRRKSPPHEFERPELTLNEPSTPQGFAELGEGMGRPSGPKLAPRAFDQLDGDSEPTAIAQPGGASPSKLSDLLLCEALDAEQPHPLARPMAMDDVPELAGRASDYFHRDRRSQTFAESDVPHTREREPFSSSSPESLPPGLAEMLRNNGGQADQQRKNDERHAELKRQQERSNEMLEQLTKESGGGARF